MRDLRESGSLEADGDVILLLHREDYYHETEPDYAKTQELKVIVAKHKSSGTGSVPLRFDNRHQRVLDWQDQRASAPDPFPAGVPVDDDFPAFS